MTMLIYNPKIRRKITYKIPVLFNEVQELRKELYSYSVFTDDFKEKEFVFNEKKIRVIQYNTENNFVDSLKVFNENNKLVELHFFTIINEKKSKRSNRIGSIILEFKESNDRRFFTSCVGTLACKNDIKGEHYILYFSRVNSYLGYKVDVKLFKNEEGDFFREEFYNSEFETLLFVLENKFEYIETELETRVQSILQNGWDIEF